MCLIRQKNFLKIFFGLEKVKGGWPVDGKWTLKRHFAVHLPSTAALAFGRQLDGKWTAIAGRGHECDSLVSKLQYNSPNYLIADKRWIRSHLWSVLSIRTIESVMEQSDAGNVNYENVLHDKQL